MKKLLRILVLFPLLVACENPDEEKEPLADNASLNVATFNIRLATEDDTGVRSWETRRPNVIATIKDNDFDVVGFQEVLTNQQEELRALLPEYSFYFVGRDDGTKGEAVGIAYKKGRFYPLNQICFWLSPTPDAPSNAKEWGGPTDKRVAAGCRLVEKASQKQFWYLVTHLEVGGNYDNVRIKSSEVILEREKAINVSGLPFFVAGGMNTIYPEETSMELLREVFSDTFLEAEEKGVREGPVGTYNAFNPDADMEDELVKQDYIFAKGGYTLNSYKAITTKFDGQYPSDHLPVVINVTL